VAIGPNSSVDVKPTYQRLDLFRLPPGFRGKPAIYVQFWWIVQALLVKPLPQICYPLRRLLLRAFGAKIGSGVLIRPGVEVTFPWKLVIGDNSWIGNDVTLYSLGPISIGANTVISQKSYVCAADHDYSQITFPIRERPVEIGDQVWIGADVWVGPGVKIGDGAVMGARSTVINDMPEGMVCVGSPCRPMKLRGGAHQASGIAQTNSIAWNGLLRCQTSAAVLLQCLTTSPNSIHLALHGTLDRLGALGRNLIGAANCRYTGPYRPENLSALLAASRFVWAIDFSEGENSKWLLPYRLYSAIAAGVPVIAADGTATGEIVRRHNLGIVLSECTAQEVIAALENCDAATYESWLRNVHALRDRALRQNEWAVVFDDITRWDELRLLPNEADVDVVLSADSDAKKAS
jgi:putative colanic acid biosynthesis acetyltransferase WcaF